jgi:hypothetical protein
MGWSLVDQSNQRRLPEQFLAASSRGSLIDSVNQAFKETASWPIQ